MHSTRERSSAESREKETRQKQHATFPENDARRTKTPIVSTVRGERLYIAVTKGLKIKERSFEQEIIRIRRKKEGPQFSRENDASVIITYL